MSDTITTPAPVETKRKRTGLKAAGIVGGIVVAFIAGTMVGVSGNSTATTATPAPTVTVTATPEPLAATPVAPPAPTKDANASNITEGTWTVGLDVMPGTYRSATAVESGCYWAITKSGTNGETIISNDLVTGGRPTVTIKAGQDFESHRCGDWVRVK